MNSKTRHEIVGAAVVVVLVAVIFIYAHVQVYATMAELRGRVQELEQENATLQQTVQILQSEKAVLQSNLTALEALKVQLENNLTQLIQQIADLQEQYDNLQAEYGDLQTSYDALQASYNDLMAAYNESLATIEELKSQIPPEVPEFHPFSVTLKLLKSEMVTGLLQNKGKAVATNVTVVLRVLVGSINSMSLDGDTLYITVSGEPIGTLFEFNRTAFIKLDPAEANSWTLTWDDTTESTKERFAFAADVTQFVLDGRVKIVIDLYCAEGVEEHWEFEYDA